jgi:hypothetical protein
MTDRYPILRSLDPWHARLGYLGALASVATRGLDTADALAARFQEMLLRRIYLDDPRFEQLMARVPEARRSELDKRMMRPEQEDPSAAFTESAPIESEVPPPDWPLGTSSKRPKPRLVRTEWLYVSEFWLYDTVMPSPLGHLVRERLDRTIDLARWTGVLLPTLELAEPGYLLKHFLDRAQEREGLDDILFNRLNLAAHECLRPLYFRIMLAHEILFPFLLNELVDRTDAGEKNATRGQQGLLLCAVKRLLRTIGEITDPEDAPAVRDVEKFHDSIEQKDSTQENYLRPRLEMLVDLGFLHRRVGTDGKRSDFMWEVTDATRLLAAEMRGLTTVSKGLPGELERYLDRAYFGSMARALGRKVTPVVHDSERLLWFARAFQEIGREFGFTPGRTLALKACLLAWENGRSMEVGDAFDAVYRAARTPLDRHLHFSGGSRFDREFLIRIDDDLVAELEREVTPLV